MKYSSLLLAGAALLVAAPASAQECIDCHQQVTPGIVVDWQLSKHSQNAIDCTVCHGDHSTQVEQFSKGKHAFAWAALQAMPTTHAMPVALNEGMKGCGGCHKVGLKTEEEISALKADGAGFGVASCDACHTRHLFSTEEARQPQACQTCHMGFDHPQWEMYSGSKHGVRYLLKQNGTLPETTAAPTCQTCHMQEGDHEVRTPWGFLAVRLPLPEDEQWAADQVTILKALGVLDPEGNPTARLEVVEAAQVARLTQEDFDREREKIVETCSQCHSENFARAEIAKGDDMIREADHLLAQAIEVIAALYQDGILEQPEGYASAYPDLLTFHDAPTPIEQRLLAMHLEHRMRAFQGTFHANPDYALRYGWSEMVRDLSEIKQMAEEMRRAHAEGASH